MKLKIICTILFLFFIKINYAQDKRIETLFKGYLQSKDRVIAKQIAASNDSIYSIYCVAALSTDAHEKIKGYSAFIALNPAYGLASAYQMRGQAYISTEKDDSALYDFKAAIRLDSANAYTYYYMATAYMDSKKTDSAILTLNHAINLNPGFVLAYHTRGVCYDNKKKYADAIADFTKEIKLDKTSDMGYMMRGYVYYEMENYKLAIKDWQKAEKLNPDHTKSADELIGKSLQKLME